MRGEKSCRLRPSEKSLNSFSRVFIYEPERNGGEHKGDSVTPRKGLAVEIAHCSKCHQIRALHDHFFQCDSTSSCVGEKFEDDHTRDDDSDHQRSSGKHEVKSLVA